MNMLCHSLIVIGALSLGACADGLTELSGKRSELTASRQVYDMTRIEAGLALVCGSGLDVHMVKAAQDDDYASGVVQLCGPLAAAFLAPQKPEE